MVNKLGSPVRQKARKAYPSFSGLSASTPASSKAKQANLASNTVPELKLRAALRAKGLRFKVNCAAIPGRPDVVFTAAKLAVFCDGDFWHGRDWKRLRPLLERRSNADYWVAKIAANRRRDVQITRELGQAGWSVIRLWESEIRKDAGKAAELVAAVLSGERATAARHTVRR